MSNRHKAHIYNTIMRNKMRYQSRQESQHTNDLMVPMWDKRMLTGKRPKPFQPLPNTVSHAACDRSVSSLNLACFSVKRFMTHLFDM